MASEARELVADAEHVPSSCCPHCRRPYPEDAPRTDVYCGECGKRHVFFGTKGALARTSFECDGCGELNVIPEPWGGAD